MPTTHMNMDFICMVQLLQKKQRETEKMSSIPSVNKKKIQELEIGKYYCDTIDYHIIF